MNEVELSRWVDDKERSWLEVEEGYRDESITIYLYEPYELTDSEAEIAALELSRRLDTRVRFVKVIETTHALSYVSLGTGRTAPGEPKKRYIISPVS